MTDYEDAPYTFPGAGWYPPEIASAPTATGLGPPETDEERDELRERERARQARGIGFTANSTPRTRQGEGKSRRKN